MMPKFTNSRRKGKVAGHVRSASLPCQLHPLIMNLAEKISGVQSWVAGVETSNDSIEAGLSLIKHLVLALNNFFGLSDTHRTLKHEASITECILENLCLIDSYGSLLSDLVELKQHQFEVQSALRRHDSKLLTSSLKSQKQIQKDPNYLRNSLRATTKSMSLIIESNSKDVNIFKILKNAVSTMSAASMVLFSRVIAVSVAASMIAASSDLCTVTSFRKKISHGEKYTMIHERFEELEHCVRIVEDTSNRVLKSLVNCRVAVLNIQSNLF